MVKTTIIETTEKYDENGKLLEKITREETTEDNTVYNTPTYPWINPSDWYKPDWTVRPELMPTYKTEITSS